MSAPPATSSVRDPWLLAFGAVAVAQLVCIALRLPVAGVVTWLVAPPLAVWVWRAGGPTLLVLALASAWIGDVLGNPRLLGMGATAFHLSIAAFAAAHVLLVVLFVVRYRGGAPEPRRSAVAVLYLVLASAALAATWGGLGPALRVVAPVYLLLIVVMATTAFLLDTRVGVGAGLLFGSHLLVALEVGQRLDGARTAFRLAVTTLSALGILLIAVGVVRRAARDRDDDAGGVSAGRPPRPAAARRPTPSPRRRPGPARR